jgi:ABC-type cobalt transport system substrate-binding protein
MKKFSLILTILILIILVTCLIYASIQFFKAIKNMFAIINEYKSGINPWGSQTLFNPFNGLIFMNLLTDKVDILPSVNEGDSGFKQQ